MIIQDEIRKKIFLLQDEKYKNFSLMLNPGEKTIIGVRIPFLKQLAKEIAAGDYQDFLTSPHTDYHEECMLYGLVLGYLKTDIDSLLAHFDRWLYCINNWSVCDSCIMNLKAFKKSQNQSKVLEYTLNRLKTAQEPYIIRAMLVVLFCYFNSPEYLKSVKEAFIFVKDDHYYIKMAIAWGMCELLIKNYDKSVHMLIDNSLEKWTHNKAIQKAVESFRIPNDRKEFLKTLKR